MTVYKTLKDAEQATKDVHCRIVCTCGAQLQNCRCFSPDKITVAVQDGCDTCKIAQIKGSR